MASGSLRLFLNGKCVELGTVEISSDNSSHISRIEIILDGQVVGNFSKLAAYPLSISFTPPFLLIWSGMDLFSLDLNLGIGKSISWEQDEIHEIYPLVGGWCVVGETSVFVTDRWFSEVLANHFIGEIVMKSWYQGGRLYLRDLQERTLVFELQAEDGLLLQIE